MHKQKFIRPEQALLEAGLRSEMTVADLGAGNGFFTLAASPIVGDQGKIWAVDILEGVLSKIMSTARLMRRKNIRTLRCDLDASDTCAIEPLSCDFAVIGKVLPQMKQPKNLVRESYRILKTGGTALVIEWKKAPTPIGPPFEMRVSEDDARELFTSLGFRFIRHFEPDNYHYALIFQK